MEKLRFDFTHSSPLTKDELKKVSFLLNKKIRQDLPVLTEELSLSKAQQRGAIALFEEKYKVRVNGLAIARSKATKQYRVSINRVHWFFANYSEFGIILAERYFNYEYQNLEKSSGCKWSQLLNKARTYFEKSSAGT